MMFLTGTSRSDRHLRYDSNELSRLDGMALLQTSLRQLPTPPRVLEAVPRAVEEEREKMQMSLDRLAMQVACLSLL